MVSEDSVGVGIGWLTTQPFSNDRHSVGIHLGANHYGDGGFPDENKKLSGKVLGQYVYNFNGLGESGFHFSVWAGAGSAEHEGRFQTGIGAGYRF